MKKYDDEILKYLSGLMSPGEKNNFEEKLLNDPSLKEELEKVNSTLANINSIKDIELNEIYFNNLLPKVRNNLAGYKRRKLLKEYALIVPAVIIILFTSYTIFMDLKSEIDYSTSIAGEVVNNIDDDELANNLLNDYSFESVIPYQSSRNNLDIYIPENLNLSLSNVSHYVDFAKIDYSQVENISGPELERLYNNLSMINFEKVSK
ncbi:MAG: hypothetical protein GYA14_08240 [Ignavibacteria bacterium]|nr:hypothetical protein [Ignavibacteria bacterium]